MCTYVLLSGENLHKLSNRYTSLGEWYTRAKITVQAFVSRKDLFLNATDITKSYDQRTIKSI